MNWLPLLLVAAMVLLALIMKRTGQISAADARALLKKGARVIDVRSPGEFNSGHLPMAVNIPLDEVETGVPRQVNDKSQPLLLHCQSGMRSGMACRKLKKAGYPNVYNLGSLARAGEIVGAPENK
ncbi:MAG TPA: rhodanese-like domain-containing protein [Candidatus Acidoferrum sp.]|nr:rhodanese-like domain-containing protein [Candidatus Acidoferrum sp.]